MSPAILGGMDDPIAELPAMVDAGVPTAKAFMVFDFRLGDRAIFEAMRVLGDRGGMLQLHCEDPVLIDMAIEDGAKLVVSAGLVGPPQDALQKMAQEAKREKQVPEEEPVV